MKTNNDCIQNSVRCLAHPASLTCVGLLLLNDHVLKALSPSWLTGKLSDYAGLFFAPFLVAALMGLVLRDRGLSLRQVGLISAGATGIIFLLLKVSVPFNSLAAQAASAVLGRSVQYALDWTDLAALVTLMPAVVLWNHNGRMSRGRWAYVALGLAALATLATSPSAPQTVVTKFKPLPNVIYAYGNDWGNGYFSEDQGATWSACLGPKGCNVNWPEPQASEVCDDEAEATCYRIMGKPEVEVSGDGGKTWSVSWQVPPARLALVERSGGPEPARCLVISGGTHRYLLVAMGADGILRKELPDGAWERIAVGNAIPKPYAATSLAEAISLVSGEMAVWMGLALVMFVATGLLIWNRAGPSEGGPENIVAWAAQSVMRIATIIVLGTGLYGVLLVLLATLESFLGLPGWIPMLLVNPIAIALLLYALIFISFVVRIRHWAEKADYDHVRRLHISRAWLLVAVGIAAVGGLSWILWAFGIIWDYWTALITAACSGLLIAAVGWRTITRDIDGPTN